MIAFDPWQLDVTSYLKEGSNTIDVHVIGSLKNLLARITGIRLPAWHLLALEKRRQTDIRKRIPDDGLRADGRF